MRYSVVYLLFLMIPALVFGAPGDKALFEQTGGPDILVKNEVDLLSVDLAIGPDGTIFALVARDGMAPPFEDFAEIFRSTDGGESFFLWSQVGGGGAGSIRPGDLMVVGGTVPRVFFTYTTYNPDYEALVAFADPSLAVPVWTHVTAMSGAPRYSNTQLVTDVAFYSDYYLYLVATGDDGNGDDVWFARSLDYGATWETPYKIADASADPNIGFAGPKIAIGQDEILHVICFEDDKLVEVIDATVLYIRGGGEGATIADWEAPRPLTPPGDGIDQINPEIAASLASPEVVATYAESGFFDPQILASTNRGGDWSWPGVDLPFDKYGRVVYDPTGHLFRGVGTAYDDLGRESILLSQADPSTPLVWSNPLRINDLGEEPLFGPVLAVDPTHGGQVGVFFREDFVDRKAFFDAEWRSDAGIPRWETGFPVGLTDQPTSSPALVDLDGDGFLEIVFGDAADQVQVLDHTGTPRPGWPVTVPGLTAADGAIAIGDLGQGEPSIVVGAASGMVHAFDRDGQVQPGWPLTIPGGGATYLAIGAMGGPYPRTVVACSGEVIYFINYGGVSPLGTSPWVTPGLTMNYPPAIGDIDGDGVAEVVVVVSDLVAGIELYSTELEFLRDLPGTVVASPVLADLDGDGAVEIIVADNSDFLYAMDGTGADFGPGWPYSLTSGYQVSGLAVADVTGSGFPDIVARTQNRVSYLVDRNGGLQPGYPVQLYPGSPDGGGAVIGMVQGQLPDVVISTPEDRIWAHDDIGNLVPGWPQNTGTGGIPLLSPAMGDIDQDGYTEIVFLGNDDLMIFDVGIAPGDPYSTWAMFGHDPQRTGCSDCPEDVVTPVPGDQPERPARVAFAGASPNPVAGASTTFRFEVPVRAQVQVEVFDLRGHRVRRVMRAEVSAGSHAAHWDGRDSRGNRVASGQYLARLKVKGPGIEQELTRRVTVVR